jgi:hypothetical protein
MLDNLTDPFTRGLNSTSWDGGVVWFNVPVAPEPYIVRAVLVPPCASCAPSFCCVVDFAAYLP